MRPPPALRSCPVRQRLSLLFLFALALIAATAALAGSSRNGPDRIAPSALAAVPASAAKPGNGPRCPLPERFRPAFERAADETHLSLSLLVALAQVESNFRPDAVSHAGARGLLQVLPSTAREVETDPDDPEANVLAGARYLRRMLDRFHTFDLALAAYNAGPTAVARAGQAPTVETGAYVREVYRHWQALAGCS
jgi:soluble lytic murein transglycosylase-like protein